MLLRFAATTQISKAIEHVGAKSDSRIRVANDGFHHTMQKAILGDFKGSHCMFMPSESNTFFAPPSIFYNYHIVCGIWLKINLYSSITGFGASFCNISMWWRSTCNHFLEISEYSFLHRTIEPIASNTNPLSDFAPTCSMAFEICVVAANRRSMSVSNFFASREPFLRAAREIATIFFNVRIS